MTTHTLTRHIPKDDRSRAQIFRTLVISLVVLCLCYVYLIGSITFNVLARKSLETSARVVSSHVSELELEYIALSNSLDAKYGATLGFTEARGTIFANRDSGSVAMR